jgi:hypothetical protein
MKFLHRKALDNDGEELIHVGFQIGLSNGKFRVRIGRKFIGAYETEEQALDVKQTIDEALFITYGSVAE